MILADRECPGCGAAFQVSAAWLRHGRGKFCSTSCQYAHQMAARVAEFARVESVCIGCGTGFVRLASTTRNKVGAGKYCTRVCRDANRRGPLNPLFRGYTSTPKYGPTWAAAKRAARKQQKFCQECTAESGLHVHHKTPIRLFADTAEANRQENLIVLCASCHRTEEARWLWSIEGGRIVRRPVHEGNPA